MPKGFGSSGYGASPFGAVEDFTLIPPGGDFDLFCFESCATMPDILASPMVTLLGQGPQFVINYPPPTCDLGVLSGDISNGAFPTDDAALFTEPPAGVPSRWTLEWTVLFEELPVNFNDLLHNHIFFGGSDASGPVAGIFVSRSGIAYTGSVHISGGNLIIDSAVEPLPDTAGLIREGVYITFRLAVDGISGAVFLFVTESDVVGQTLVAVLPVIDAATVAFPPTDQAYLSVRGTTSTPSRIQLDQWCMASSVLVPNLPPIANAGADQAIRLCAVARFDGSGSLDPEGAPLTYRWRLIDGPITSAHVATGNDGRTYPLLVPTGFTNKFHSVTLGNLHAVDALVAGEVLLINGESYLVGSTGTDVNGFFVQLASELPDNLVSTPYKLLRQRGISGATTVTPTFFPDVTGFYKFELTVNDGQLPSVPSIVVLNVVESLIPRGVTPDLTFIFSYLSDYWSLVEGKERIATYWSSLAQCAATELFTLWQIEYSKSHRDIQRTFNRRWLHYDLVLGEPLPELTKLRVFYSGVVSSPIPLAGVGGISGTSLVLSSPELAEEAVLDLAGPNPFTAQALAKELQNRLSEIDSRFSTSVILKRDATEVVRINAPFPFTVLSTTTTPVFTAGSINGLLSGTGGQKLSSRSYKTSVSLQGLGLMENDLLVVDGQAFRVASVVDDPLDAFPAQRVVVKSDMPALSGAWALSGYITSTLLDFYNGLVDQGDAVYFEVLDTSSLVASTQRLETLISSTALGICADAPSVLPCDFTPLGSLPVDARVSIRLAKLVRRHYVPVDDLVVDIPTLTQFIQIQDDKSTLRRNVDYYVEATRGHNALRFESGLGGGPDVWEGAVPPDRLWAEYTYLDNTPVIEANFGIPVEFTLDQLAELPGNVDYLSAVRGLWYSYSKGPTLANLRIGAQILLGLPFAEEAGTIEEIRTDFSPTLGRMLIRDTKRREIVRSYTFLKALDLEINPDTGVPYAVGDTVGQFAPLVTGVEIVDYVKDPTWYEGLLKQGSFFEIEKFFKFLVRIDSAAFNLAALIFTRSFILKLKPTYTFPVFLVEYVVPDTEVDITDELHYKVVLTLEDTPCEGFLSSTRYDDAKPGGGGYWNQFDNRQGQPPPTFPVPNVPVDWAYDRFILCPKDSLVIGICCDDFLGGPMVYDSCFAYDTPVSFGERTQDSGPFSVPSGGTGLALTFVTPGTAPITGTIASVRLLITGGPGTDPTGYELVVSINAVDTIFIPFTSGPIYTELTTVTAAAVTLGDTLGVRVRHAGGAARNPAWTDVKVRLLVDGGQWTYDDSLPAGMICGVRVVVP